MAQSFPEARLQAVFAWPRGERQESERPQDFTVILLLFLDESLGRRGGGRVYRRMNAGRFWGSWVGDLNRTVSITPDQPLQDIDWDADTLDLLSAVNILDAADERFHVPWSVLAVSKIPQINWATQTAYYFNLVGLGNVGVGTEDETVYRRLLTISDESR